MTADTPSFDALSTALLDLEQPMGKRTRAVFYLRTRGGKQDLKVLLIGMIQPPLNKSILVTYSCFRSTEE
jgi:hypothetical protein